MFTLSGEPDIELAWSPGYSDEEIASMKSEGHFDDGHYTGWSMGGEIAAV